MIKNIKELRNDLLEQYEGLKKDPRKLNQCAELANTAGKVLASVKLEFEFAGAIGAIPTCDFMIYDGAYLKQSEAGKLQLKN